MRLRTEAERDAYIQGFESGINSALVTFELLVLDTSPDAAAGVERVREEMARMVAALKEVPGVST